MVEAVKKTLGFVVMGPLFGLVMFTFTIGMVLSYPLIIAYCLINDWRH